VNFTGHDILKSRQNK